MAHRKCENCISIPITEFADDLSVGDIVTYAGEHATLSYEVQEIEATTYRVCECAVAPERKK